MLIIIAMLCYVSWYLIFPQEETV